MIGWEPSRIERALGSVESFEFPAEDSECPSCGAPTKVYKTRRRRVVTLARGQIQARETQRYCEHHPTRKILRSRALRELVPSGQSYGYDLIVRVGLWRYKKLLQRREIQARLATRWGIEVSEATISNLSDRFLRHLAALHRKRVPALREAMAAGYPLHVDGTHYYKPSGGLFACYDGWRGWILHAGRMDGEKAEQIEPVIRQAVDWFGRPIAVVHDQGSGCEDAVEFLAEDGVPDLLCHFHVLKNLGKRLLSRPRRRLERNWRLLRGAKTLRELLGSLESIADSRSRQVATAIYWVLEGEGKTPARFPFGTAVFDQIERLLGVFANLEIFASAHARLAYKPKLDELADLVDATREDGALQKQLRRFRARKRLFDEARAVFRLTDPSRSRDPLLPDIEIAQNREIEKHLDRWQKDLRRRLARADRDLSEAIEVVLETLETLRHRLFGHPFLSAVNGRVLRVVARTNNPLEQLFSRQAQKMRRRTGRKGLSRDLRDLPAQALLVPNLADPLYVKLLAGSPDALPNAFATVEPDSQPLRPRRYKHLERRLRSLRQQIPAPLLDDLQTASALHSNRIVTR